MLGITVLGFFLVFFTVMVIRHSEISMDSLVSSSTRTQTSCQSARLDAVETWPVYGMSKLHVNGHQHDRWADIERCAQHSGTCGRAGERNRSTKTDRRCPRDLCKSSPAGKNIESRWLR